MFEFEVNLEVSWSKNFFFFEKVLISKIFWIVLSLQQIHIEKSYFVCKTSWRPQYNFLILG